jgi:hypothetical protein
MLCLLVFLGVPATASCQTLLLQGEMTQGYHVNVVASGPPGCPEWCLSLTVTNVSNGATRIDEIRVGWAAFQKKGMQTVTTRQAKAEMPYWLLAPGTAETFDFRTNGYTYDIILNADGEQIYVYIEIYNAGVLTDGTYMAIVPDLDQLPSYGAVVMGSREGKDIHGRPITFYLVP